MSFIMVKRIAVNMIVDRDISRFHYLKVIITTEHDISYDLMIQVPALIKFLNTFHN